MKYRILRLVALFLLLINLSSCYERRWAHYHDSHFYGHRRHYASYHWHHNRDW